ncbi:MAG: hypothetical protein PHY47_05600 [Lachnospiraceae bacterium]|nr:hypothetical protein [Lachnospiraceae bacterium]
MAITVTVANAERLTPSTPNSFLDITFTNTNAFSYAANSKIYYYALLTDATSGAALTREVTFVVSKSSAGDIDAGDSEPFIFENTTNLVSPITASNGRICYVAQS